VTLPRQILPGRTYLITRRCTQRQFLLRPSRMTNQNVEYCLALAAERTGVLLHAACVMSNNWHGVVSDPEARLPEFLEIFHKLLAKVQNASLGRWENLWSSDKTSVVLLVSEAEVLEKMAYTLANPHCRGAAGPVKSPDEWPGVISLRFGKQREVEMPDIFFDDEGELPDCVTLIFMRPNIYLALRDSELYARLRDTVATRVKRAREDMALRRLPFVGRNAVLRQSFSAVPKTPAPRRNPSPALQRNPRPRALRACRRCRHRSRNDPGRGDNVCRSGRGVYRHAHGAVCPLVVQSDDRFLILTLVHESITTRMSAVEPALSGHILGVDP